MASESRSAVPRGHIDPDYRVVVALREVTLRLNVVGAEFAADNHLHTTDLRAIIELLDAERMGHTATPTWLAGRLRLNSASVTALVDRLERMGHVQRARAAADRRRVQLTVTDNARRLGETFFGPLIGRIVAIMDSFDPPERDAITRFLAAVAAAVPDGPAGQDDGSAS
jgi:DNA-binding MarR family transcriptional regulator